MPILKVGGEERQVKAGESFIEVAEEIGVPFGCTQGICGTCSVTVVEGMENLNPPTDEEKEMGCEGNMRLTCQLRISKGEVRLEV